jgi:hypothetical protein
MSASFANSKVAEGVALMRQIWERNGKKIKEDGAKSISFVDPKLGARGKVAFRIRLNPPTIEIYDGERDVVRGSPLMKPPSESKKKHLIEFGFNMPGYADRKKPLEDADASFYQSFVQYALRVCRDPGSNTASI